MTTKRPTAAPLAARMGSSALLGALRRSEHIRNALGQPLYFGRPLKAPRARCSEFQLIAVRNDSENLVAYVVR
jgi:hypothetical protein